MFQIAGLEVRIAPCSESFSFMRKLNNKFGVTHTYTHTPTDAHKYPRTNNTQTLTQSQHYIFRGEWFKDYEGLI